MDSESLALGTLHDFSFCTDVDPYSSSPEAITVERLQNGEGLNGKARRGG